MMRVLLDTDVILDLMLDRPGHADNAAALWRANEENRLEAFVSAVTPVNVYYIARKLKGAETARQAVQALVSSLRVCPMDHKVLSDALVLPFKDYEDAVQHASATASQLDAIVTRNGKDYQGATLSIYSPADIAKQLSSATE